MDSITSENGDTGSSKNGSQGSSSGVIGSMSMDIEQNVSNDTGNLSPLNGASSNVSDDVLSNVRTSSLVEPRQFLFDKLQDKNLNLKQHVETWFLSFVECNNFEFYNIIHLMYKSSGYNLDIPIDLIKSGTVKDFIIFFGSQPSRDSYKKTTEKINDFAFRKIVENFFEFVFEFKSNYLFRCPKFGSFLIPLMLSMSDCFCSNLRYFSTVFGLKLITGLLKSGTDKKLFIDVLKDQMNYVFVKRYMDILPSTRLFCINELKRWISLKPNHFIRTQYLVFVIHSLQDETSATKLSSLQICGFVLLKKKFDPKLNDFASTLSVALCKLINENHLEIVKKSTNLYILLHTHYPTCLIAQKFHIIYDVMFSKNRNLAVASSEFFLQTQIENKINDVDKLYHIIKFWTEIGVLNPELIIDSIFDDCNCLTNWEIFCAILLDESYDFTDIEKIKFLELMAYIAEYIANREYPQYRSGSNIMPVSKIRIFKEKQLTMTEKMLPEFLKLLDYGHQRKDEKWISLLVKIVQFFNFNIVKEETARQICDRIYSYCIDKNYCSLIVLNSFETLSFMMNKISDVTIQNYSRQIQEKIIQNFLNDFQTSANYLKNDFILSTDEVSDKYYITEERKTEFLNSFLRILHIINQEEVIPKAIEMIPIEILKQKFPVEKFGDLTIQYVIILYSWYFRNEIKKWENLTDNIEKVEYLMVFLKFLNIFLENYLLTSYGETYFLIIYDLAIGINKLKLPKYLENQILTNDIKNNCGLFIKTYVSVTMDAVFMKQDCLTKFLELIKIGILPHRILMYSFRRYLENAKTFKPILKKYLKQFAIDNPDDVGRAISDIFIVIYTDSLDQQDIESSFTYLCQLVDELGLLFLPYNKEVQKMVTLVHIKGIEFALSSSGQNTNVNEFKNLKFLLILARFSFLLTDDSEIEIMDYLLERSVNENNSDIQFYIQSIISKKRYFLSNTIKVNNEPINGHIINQSRNDDVSDVDIDHSVIPEQRHNLNLYQCSNNNLNTNLNTSNGLGLNELS